MGPKLALNILSGIESKDLAGAIKKGDIARLNSVPGVGKKTAERVVLELKNKLGSENIDIKTHSRVSASGDEIDALVTLGYSASQAREALSHVPAEIKDISDRVKEALKNIGKQ